MIFATLSWTRDHFDRRAFAWTAALLLGASILGGINQWPAIAMGLSTTEPVLRQVAPAVGGMLFGAVLTALVGGMFAGVAALTARIHIVAGLDARALWLRGAALALVAIGVDVALATFAPDTRAAVAEVRRRERLAAVARAGAGRGEAPAGDRLCDRRAGLAQPDYCGLDPAPRAGGGAADADQRRDRRDQRRAVV